MVAEYTPEMVYDKNEREFETLKDQFESVYFTWAQGKGVNTVSSKARINEFQA